MRRLRFHLLVLSLAATSATLVCADPPAQPAPPAPSAGPPKPAAQSPTTDPPKPGAPAPAKPAPAKPDPAKPKPDAKPQPPTEYGPPPKLTPQDDGSTLVDDKFVMKGKGTAEDPYRITWEMLVSAQDTYQPRLKKRTIPGRIKMLDGKHIRISGYIAFPIMAQSADEMLMMLNQWDGCCIGVPPTPYDAVEVKLKKAAKGDDRLRTTGTLQGVLKVDPYLVRDWLVSLYVMEDGELTEAGGKKDPSQHAAP